MLKTTDLIVLSAVALSACSSGVGGIAPATGESG